MDHNDEVLSKSVAGIKLLLDANIFSISNDIADAVGIHLFDLLDSMQNVDYFLSTAVINEIFRGREGMSGRLIRAFRNSLHDELMGEGTKDGRVLYERADGTIGVAKLSGISREDMGQILLCQNHRDLVLVTNDHNMLKNGSAVLDRRIMDYHYLLSWLIDHTPDKQMKKRLQVVLRYYSDNWINSTPKTVHKINDRKQLGNK